MDTATTASKQPRRGRWQFSLATLFVLTTVVCLVLSQFYPRIYAAADVQVRTMPKALAPTYMALAASDTMVSNVLARHPELADTAGASTDSWIRTRLEVNHLEKNTIEIRMSGRPRERKRLKQLVDAIAEEYVAFLVDMERSTENEELALLQSKRDELQDTSSQPDGEGARRAELLKVLNRRIEEIEQRQKKDPLPAKVLRHRSGLEW